MPQCEILLFYQFHEILSFLIFYSQACLLCRYLGSFSIEESMQLYLRNRNNDTSVFLVEGFVRPKNVCQKIIILQSKISNKKSENVSLIKEQTLIAKLTILVW